MEATTWIGGALVVGIAALFAGSGTCDFSHGSGIPPPPPVERGVLFRTVAAAGRDNKYAVYVPRDLDLGKPAPAIVFLNGRGECGTDGSKQLAVGLLPAVFLNPEKWPFVIVFPQKPNQQDTWAQHEELVLACLSAASREFNLDPARIYLTGLSQGGAGTWEIGSRHPELFAAIAPLCGFVNAPRGATSGAKFGGDAERRAVAEPLAAARMPVWVFHGEKDDAVPVDQTRELMAALKRAGASPDRVKATYYPDANHNCWDKTYREEAIGEWFLGHRRGEVE
jgi:predicted peptidase